MKVKSKKKAAAQPPKTDPEVGFFKVLKAWSSEDGQVALELNDIVELELTNEVDDLVKKGVLELSEDEDGDAILAAIKSRVDALMRDDEKVKGYVRGIVEEKFGELEKKTKSRASARERFGKMMAGEGEVRDLELEDPLLGFKSASHFLHDLREHAVQTKGGKPTTKSMEGYLSRLDKINKAYDGQVEAIGEEGGILIPSQMSEQIYERAFKQNPLLSRVDSYSARGNSIAFPRAKDSSRLDGSRHSGVLSAWVSEGGQIDLQKLKNLEQMRLQLQKLAVLVKLTNELVSDAGPAAEQWVVRNVADEIAFQVGLAIFEGDGEGKPLGFSNAPACLSVTRATAGKVVAADVISMAASLWAPSLSRAVWYVNQRIPWEHFMTMFIGVTNVAGNENVGGQLIYMPPGGLTQTPFGILFGRPVEVLEFSPKVGDDRDVMLVDASAYALLTKGGAGDRPAIDTAMSIHLLFDLDAVAFRATYRVDGQPWWKEAMTPFRGDTNEKYSPFVKLAD